MFRDCNACRRLFVEDEDTSCVEECPHCGSEDTELNEYLNEPVNNNEYGSDEP